MKNFSSFLTEKKGEKAHREAIAMGLQYKGFGYWVDPNTGETKYKTENDNLVPVEPDVESEMYRDGPDVASQGGQGAGGMGGQMAVPGGAAAGAMGMQNPEAGQNVLGAPEEGEELPPPDIGWDAGPDGDTCIGDDATQKPDEDVDEFVGRTNLNWKAGPDGSNLSNTDYKDLIEAKGDLSQLKRAVKIARGLPAGSDDGDMTKFAGSYLGGLKTGRRTDNIRDLAKKHGVSTAEVDPAAKLHKSVLKRLGSFLKNPEGKPDPLQFTRRTAMDAKVKGDQSLRFDGQDNTLIGAAMAMDDAGKRGREAAEKDLDQAGARRYGGGSRTRAQIYRNQARKVPATIKDADRADGLNEAAQEYLADSSFNMDNKGDELGGGVFGRVFNALDQWNGQDVVLKEGNIGPEELMSLKMMEDDDRFPTLINAEFTGPFNYDSAVENNPFGGSTRMAFDSKYFDPDEEEDFEKRFPSAPGRFAMTRSGGESIMESLLNGDFESRDEIRDAVRQVWRARAALHRRGIAHEDMHEGNVFWDKDKKKASILDFGLAHNDPRAALREALGGWMGEDYQFAGVTDRDDLGEGMVSRLQENWESIQEKIMDMQDIDMDDEDGFDYKMQQIASFMHGGLREKPETLREVFDGLNITNDNAQEFIEMFYNGIDDDDEPEEDQFKPYPLNFK